MKKICLLFVFLSFAAPAQTVTVRGFLKDATTNQPVISASVGVKNSAIGTISNEEGNFQLSLPENAEVVISFLGYKPIAIPAADFGLDVKTIALQIDEQILEEVVISKIPIEKMLENLIVTSMARFNKPIILNTYYREFVKINGKYSKFSDGLLDYHISGSVKRNKSDLIVKQSRTAQLFTNDELKEDEMIDFDSFVNVQHGVTYNYDFTFIKKILLDGDRYENYDLELKSKKSKDGKELFAINFEPKTDSGAIYKGSIVFDPEAKLIFDIDIDLISENLKFKERNILVARVTFMGNTIKAGYKLVGNNYILSYSSRFNKLRITMKKRKYDKTIESKSDIIVTDLHVDDLTYNKKEIYKEKDLYARGNKYTDKFWLENNSLVLTTGEQQIINELEKAATAGSK
ncbi:hypothetical protein FNO01nite_12940 [Flavobacterium noncentrifugens]|uniref:CarboxypepD_reg-like domain-containing protein n=1 Tax=Flavobacterium noncentrifugens TaxID=1128970 RepID=A0A1G8VRH9_9FLAO|nr:carboxypeptidase-like regulatory domain-containing protein [Flavobacterium noncentrifugens]GEP50622.1 hypothetical protein FNO01nite_12940 [Flavobacterium noncentrifugens]SDJ68632.1 CarboxypepD_reg-like domain-containing protein [Flavobacterium noncentrifugens]